MLPLRLRESACVANLSIDGGLLCLVQVVREVFVQVVREVSVRCLQVTCQGIVL